MPDPAPTRKQHWLAGVLLLISTLCCFHQLALLPTGLVVGPQNGGRNDLTANILPSRLFPREEILQSGTPPFWNPNELGGIPWLGNPQSAMFYPPNWLYLLSDHVAVAGWLMAAHLWLGGLGVYFYCRKLNLNWAAAVVAGCGYLGAPFLIANVGEGHYNPICVAAWVPWALVCFERLRSGQRGGVPLLALIFSMAFFCGHVQEVYYLVVMLSVWLLAACLSRERTQQHPEAPSAGVLFQRWCLVGLLTIGLTLVELLPIYSYTGQAVRSGGMSLEGSAKFSLDHTSLWQLLNPLAVGGPEIVPESGRFYWETVCHFGWLLSLLCLWGIFASWREYGGKRLSLTLLGCTLFAMGTHTPFFGLLFHYLPGVSFFRGSSRMLMFLSLWVSILAGFGVHQILKNKLQTKPVPWMLATLLVAGLVTAENARHARFVLRVIPSEEFRGDSEIVRFLKNQPGEFRVLAEQELLSDYESWRHGLVKFHGYEPVPLNRSVVLILAANLSRSLADDLMGILTTHPTFYRQSILDLAGVRFAVVPAGGDNMPNTWRQVATGTVPPPIQLTGDLADWNYEIWENTTALPRAFVLGQTKLATPNFSYSKQLGQFDPKQSVLIFQDILPEGPRQEFRPATITSAQPNRVTIEAQLDQPGYLVFTDLVAPGWQVRVNGTPQPLLFVDLIFRGVALPAGTFQVEFTYEPPGFRIGMILSALTLLGILVALAASVVAPSEPESTAESSEET